MEESARSRKPSRKRRTKRGNSKRVNANQDRSEETRRALADMLGLDPDADWHEIDARQRAEETRFGLTSDPDITLSFLDEESGYRGEDD